MQALEAAPPRDAAAESAAVEPLEAGGAAGGGPAVASGPGSSRGEGVEAGKAEAQVQLGSLEGLRRASKGGMDPDGLGTSMVASDVLWSDPVMEPGLHPNLARGVGLVYGPDMSQAFLQANGLRLILRSHEGPDARDKRGDMPDMLRGYSLDHDTPAGRVMTVFTAPDYPQFLPACQSRYNNLGAVAVLTGPTWHDPEFITFEAVRPRPKCTAYYDYDDLAATDDELVAEEIGRQEEEIDEVPGLVAAPAEAKAENTGL
ncbi:Metallo-dependent phosphatase-like protein [Haematococcus lacustris]